MFLLSFYENMLGRQARFRKKKIDQLHLKTHIYSSDGDFWIENSELSQQLLEEQRTGNEYVTFLFTIPDLHAFWNLTWSN